MIIGPSVGPCVTMGPCVGPDVITGACVGLSVGSEVTTGPFDGP